MMDMDIKHLLLCTSEPEVAVTEFNAFGSVSVNTLQKYIALLEKIDVHLSSSSLYLMYSLASNWWTSSSWLLWLLYFVGMDKS